MEEKSDLKKYVSFETANALKEAGFHEPTESYYYNGERDRVYFGLNSDKNSKYSDRKAMSAPTLQDAMAWIRDTAGVSIDIRSFSDVEDCDYEFSDIKEPFFSFEWSSVDLHGNTVSLGDTFGEWEDAADDAVRHYAESAIGTTDDGL